MNVLVYYYINDDFGEFEYTSKFNRINAKGIKEEATKMAKLKFGSIANHFEIDKIYRQN